MSRKRTRVWVLLACLAAALSTSPAWADGRLFGSAKTVDGQPVEAVEVQLIPLNPSLPTIKKKSDEKGVFVFGLVRPADYRLVAFKDGMRIVHIDVNIAEDEDKSVWAYQGPTPPGTELPAFTVTSARDVTYHLQFEPSKADPGPYGTGQASAGVQAIVENLQAGRAEDALRDIEAGLAAQPNHLTYNYLHAFALRMEGRLDEALAAVDRTLEAESDFEGARLLKARILEEKGEHQAALSLYTQEGEQSSALEVRRDAQLGRGRVLQKLGRTDEATAALEAVIDLAPDHTDAYRMLADLYRQQGDDAKAAEMMTRLGELGDEDPDLLFNLGAKAYNEGNLEQAAAQYARVVEIKPDYADAWLQLGFARLGLGDRDGAAEAMKQYVKLVPEGQDAETARQLLATLEPAGQ